MRLCPRCSCALHPFTHEGDELDVCLRCKGALLEPARSRSQRGDIVDPANWGKETRALHVGRSRLRCPAHPHASAPPMHTYRLGLDEQSLEIESCLDCQAVWLDAGEIDTLTHLADAQAKAANGGPQVSAEPALSVGFSGTTVGYLFRMITGFPSEVHHPVVRPVVVVPGLVVAILLFFALQRVVADVLWAPLMMVRANVLHLRLPHTLLTHALLHASVVHVAGNAYFLYIFGDNLEDYLGHTLFTVLFLLSVVGGGVLYAMLAHDKSIALLGASGGVAGLMGAYAVFFPHVRIALVKMFVPFQLGVLWYVGLWILRQVLMAIVYPDAGTAWTAHIGGFVVGVGFALLIRESDARERPREV